MRDYVIITDSSCDLPAEMADALELTVVPLSVWMEGKTYYNYLDGRELTAKKFFDLLRAGKLATTSGCSVGQFEEAMEPLLQQGKDILYLGFDSAVSATYNSGRLAAENLREKYPEACIEAIDTTCATLGQGLIIYLAVQLKRQGKSLQEVRDFVEENKGKVYHWILIEDLFHLKRGGRLSGASAALGSVLKVKPIIYINREGGVDNMDKARGRKAALRALLQHVEEHIAQPAKDQLVYICHGDCLEDAQLLADMIKEKLGVTQFVINFSGPVIGNHTGPGMLGVFYMGKTER